MRLFNPDDFLRDIPDTGPYRYRFLAQGDSWFSMGALPPVSTTNLLMELAPSASSCAVNCARPGATLRRMTDSVQDPKFRALLSGRQSWAWDGILLSAGGNDLIDAVQVLPRYAGDHPLSGLPIPPERRILLRPDEWKPVASAERYLSDAGWLTFSIHLVALFAELQMLRDGPGSRSPQVPVFVHCYDYLVPRDAPAGFGQGPWLLPAMQAYGIPSSDWAALGVVLIDRLKSLLQGIGMPNLHVIDTTGTLIPANPNDTGRSNDWQNEIHPTKGGYKKLAKKYAAEVDRLFP